MSTIQVQSPGMFTTVQDLGRYGYGPLGVSPSGAGDPLALRVGNLLVGNLESAAALEMTLLGGTFVFPEGAIVARRRRFFGNGGWLSAGAVDRLRAFARRNAAHWRSAIGCAMLLVRARRD